MYEGSIHKHDKTTLCIDNVDGQKALIARGGGELYEKLEGREILADGTPTKVCTLCHHNAEIIRGAFPHTRPVPHTGHKITIGLGDRLGLASPGHIRAIKGTGVFPVLAQQSIRELHLTRRTYNDVLDATTWAVFQEGYTGGYGADGDHLKTAEEVKYALDSGFTMITLDCSEHINAGGTSTQEQKSVYAGKTFDAGGVSISFTPDELERVTAVYYGAVKHTIDIYREFIDGGNIDFEMSIDETTFTTTPQAHFFVANELKRSGVTVRSIAPRFCGEFQKGIDYIGDVSEFRREFAVHARIARYFGYKLSVHSGSDKFAVFPAVGELDTYHLKTAGTNWLEAVRVIAKKSPMLFREIFACAMASLAEAKKYYHTTENTANIPANLTDQEFPSLLEQSDARQVIHITYGQILDMYGDRIFAELHRYEADYCAGLQQHIGRHLRCLGIIT